MLNKLNSINDPYSDRLKSYFLDVAHQTAKLSYATRLQVGVIAVRDKRIIACGYNGTPPGFANRCEDEFDNTLDHVIHAEENVILFAARHGLSLNDCDLFCTHSPCVRCARMILSCGIRRFYFVNLYRTSEGIQLLNQTGVIVKQVNEM